MPSTVVAPKYVSETRSEVLDFSAFLLAGQTLASAAATASVYSGADASPSSVVASVSVYSSTQVRLVYGAGVAGTIYNILVTATLATPAGVIPLQYFLAVLPDAV